MGFLVQVPPARGYYFARPRETTWANSLMADFLAELSEQWAGSFPTHPFGLGDISNERGGAPPRTIRTCGVPVLTFSIMWLGI